MGGSKNQSEPQSSKDLSAIAKNLYLQTDPIRSALISRSSSFLGAPAAPTQIPGQVIQQPQQSPYGAGKARGRGNLPQILSTAPTTAPTAAPIANPGIPDVTQSPQYDFLKSTIEKQYGQARDNAIGSTASGGGLSRALTDIETARAGGLVAGKANLYDTEMNRAFSLATGAPLQTATSGLGQSGAIQAQIAQANASQNAAAKQGIGMGAGMMLGGK